MHMKCGIVDMGSNTVQLTIYHYGDGAFRPLLNRWETVGLAGYVEGSMLTLGGINAASQVLSEFQVLLRDLEVDRLHVFATASLRNISNSGQVIEAIRTTTGITVELLSGEDEALYSFRGAMLGAHLSSGLMADIGGGSTELVAYSENTPTSQVSLPLGGVALFSRFIEGVLPSPEEQAAISAHIAPLLDAALISPCENLLGVGGSARAVVRLCNTLSGSDPKNYTVSAHEVESLYNRFSNGDKDSLRLLLRVVPDRVHTALPGLLILRGVLARCGAKTFTMSTTGVREGYLLSRVLELANYT